MLRHVALVTTCVRGLRTGAALNGINKTMKKVMGYSSKKKHRFSSDSPTMPSPSSFSKGAHEGKRSGNSKRVAVLNKLFMTHITDLMMTGESASVFAGHGIEINRVEVAPDYKGVNVFWIAKGTSDDEVVQRILQAQSGLLRHELTQLRVMGMVPRIYFVKDKRFALITEVDVRLAKADFGEDHVPLEPAVKLRSHFELNVKLEPHLKDKIAELELATSVVDDDDDDPPPDMSQNVFGLNHAVIMNRVMKSMKKSQALHRLTDEPEKPEPPCNLHPVEYPSAKVRREAFKEFLLQRQIAQNKARKADRERESDLLLDDVTFQDDDEEYEPQARDLESRFDFDLADYTDNEDTNNK